MSVTLQRWQNLSCVCTTLESMSVTRYIVFKGTFLLAVVHCYRILSVVHCCCSCYRGSEWCWQEYTAEAADGRHRASEWLTCCVAHSVFCKTGVSLVDSLYVMSLWDRCNSGDSLSVICHCQKSGGLTQCQLTCLGTQRDPVPTSLLSDGLNNTCQMKSVVISSSYASVVAMSAVSVCSLYTLPPKAKQIWAFMSVFIQLP